MKHRGKSSKLKYEHALIEGLLPLLESIAPWEEIHSIIFGRIRPTKGSRRQIRLFSSSRPTRKQSESVSWRP